jgi:hypothetical protein
MPVRADIFNIVKLFFKEEKNWPYGTRGKEIVMAVMMKGRARGSPLHLFPGRVLIVWVGASGCIKGDGRDDGATRQATAK